MKAVKEGRTAHCWLLGPSFTGALSSEGQCSDRSKGPESQQRQFQGPLSEVVCLFPEIPRALRHDPGIFKVQV